MEGRLILEYLTGGAPYAGWIIASYLLVRHVIPLAKWCIEQWIVWAEKRIATQVQERKERDEGSKTRTEMLLTFCREQIGNCERHRSDDKKTFLARTEYLDEEIKRCDRQLADFHRQFAEAQKDTVNDT